MPILTTEPTPEPPLPDTVIPAPIGGGQYAPFGSSHYLVWSEGVIRSSGGPIYGSFDVRGLDLRTNKEITVTNAVGDQGGAVVDGDLVAWSSNTPNGNCIGCVDPGIYAKDLATGQEYSIATGFIPQYSIGVSGRKVAWIESGSTGQRVMIKDVDTNAVKLVRQVLAEEPYIVGLKMSGNYIVWNEIAYNTASVQDQVSYLKVYDLSTDQTRNVLAYTLPAQGNFSINYAVSGHRIVVQTINNTTFVADMLANTTTPLPYYGYMTNITGQGDVFVFSRDQRGTDIVGVNINNPSSVVGLVQPNPDGFSQYQFTLAGGRLVYVDASNAPSRPAPPMLKVLALPDLLK